MYHFYLRNIPPGWLNQKTRYYLTIQLLELIGKYFNLPIKNTFSQKKITEISQDLEEKRKELEKDLNTLPPPLEVPDMDKSLYI